MVTVLLYLVFIISVALAAGGVFISTKLRSSYNHIIFSTLLYYQVFIYTFGFYGVWGQVAIIAFLSSSISPELIGRFSDLAMLMGLPFLVFAWMMLLQFALDISGKKRSGWFIPFFLTGNFLVLVVVGYILVRSGQQRPASLIKYYFVCLNSVYSLIAFILIMFPDKRVTVIHAHDRRIIAPSLIFIMVAQSVPLLFYSSQLYLALIFILTFFAGNSFLPVYLSYGTLLSAFSDENRKDLSFEDFCKKYEVSPRETDIVREICNGLSNKEISDKLFITLQTVKDHTHRIYIKTNVRSRVQLINLVKELRKH